MIGKRTQGGLSRRFIGRVLLICSGIFALVNMLFVLQSTTELSQLASHVYQDETIAFSSEFNVGKERVVASPLKEGKFLELELYSSKDNVTLTINGKTRSEKSELLLRGLNVIALNEVSGEVMSSRWFDTYAI